jgi:hypothetical protein
MRRSTMAVKEPDQGHDGDWAPHWKREQLAVAVSRVVAAGRWRPRSREEINDGGNRIRRSVSRSVVAATTSCSTARVSGQSI